MSAPIYTRHQNRNSKKAFGVVAANVSAGICAHSQNYIMIAIENYKSMAHQFVRVYVFIYLNTSASVTMYDFLYVLISVLKSPSSPIKNAQPWPKVLYPRFCLKVVPKVL